MDSPLPIPPAVLEKHMAVLGKTGSGKSNAAKVIVEYLLDHGERVCIIDPTNTWWGMRLAASGNEASPYPIPIFGGERADLAIGAAHGGAIAEAIGTSNSSAIIATRSMGVKARTGFFADFAERDASLAASVGNVGRGMGLMLANTEERSAPADSVRVADSERVAIGAGASRPELGPGVITRPALRGPVQPVQPAPGVQREELTGAARRLLAVLVERAPARLTWGQVATLAGLKASGGYFNTGVRLLRGAGLVAEAGAHVTASEMAIAEAGGAKPRRRQTPAEVLAMWCDKLPAPAPAMLRSLSEREAVTPAELADLLHLQPRGGFWNKGVAMLRGNRLVEIRGGIMRLAAELR